jgi:hypothetical protein
MTYDYRDITCRSALVNFRGSAEPLPRYLSCSSLVSDSTAWTSTAMYNNNNTRAAACHKGCIFHSSPDRLDHSTVWRFIINQPTQGLEINYHLQQHTDRSLPAAFFIPHPGRIDHFCALEGFGYGHGKNGGKRHWAGCIKYGELGNG